MHVAGWSSPLRHLGSLPFFERVDGAEPTDPSGGQRVEVTARYLLKVLSPADVVAAVRGRFVDSTIEDLSAALQRVAEAEGVGSHAGGWGSPQGDARECRRRELTCYRRRGGLK